MIVAASENPSVDTIGSLHPRDAFRPLATNHASNDGREQSAFRQDQGNRLKVGAIPKEHNV
ncbi:MAG: hypothetical protein NTZ14_06830 [Hyphomicrobiales bacterium]|nr:hypothetical protein [Hyphomicrobiales bacterium]